jgi:formate hydrogenlyase subunit 3/multisubunit Na+/H+ antiporter MnhD subunit
MWEEEPWYQKQQARLIGFGVALLVTIYIVFAIANHDWDLLRQILLFVGAFTIAFSLIFGFVWLVVRIFSCRHSDTTKSDDTHDA